MQKRISKSSGHRIETLHSLLSSKKNSYCMAIEKYVAAASLGLFIMFVGEIITLYNFMQDTPEQTSSFILDPDPKIFQYISIGVAPATVMAGVSFFLTKRYGSKPVGLMIIAGGAILLGGMAFAHYMISGINPAYESKVIPITTPLFMVVSIPIIIVGTRLLKIKKRKSKKDYF